MSLGFRVKSGRAVVVALRGSREHCVPLLRMAVDLSDPAIKETRQPYHSGFGTAQEDEVVIARLTTIIERCAKRSIDDLLARAELKDQRCPGACLVVGSLIDPATVGNPHVRAHANEGRLFRRVVEDALAAHGITCTVVRDRDLIALAVQQIETPEAQIRRTVLAWGKTLGSPWRADEKNAAIAAWMALG